MGDNAKKLSGGPAYKFPVKPQQIIALRCRTAQAVATPKPLTKWDELVPAAKRAALNRYLPDKSGHPAHDVDLQNDQGEAKKAKKK